jgi:hypothetical protein
MQGGNDEEHALHCRFRHLAMHGEWFRPGPDLVAYIEDVQRGRRPRVHIATRAVVAVTLGAALTAVVCVALLVQLGGI